MKGQDTDFCTHIIEKLNLYNDKCLSRNVDI
jgi:hypothetical protein